MANAGRGEDKETVEDAAARVLAAALGYGSTWHADEVRRGAGERNEDGTPMRRNPDALAVRHQGDVIEQAGRYLPGDYGKQPVWVTWLSPERHAAVKAWSDANPLQTHRGELGELEAWSLVRVEVSIPRVRLGSRTLDALHDASLTRPQAAMLRTYAVEDRGAAETVVRFATAVGHDREIVRNALVYRVLYPDARRLHHNVKDRAFRIGMREGDYRVAENAAAGLLRTWLHDASVAFMRAHGPVKRVVIPSTTLRKTMPKRSRPRFSKGWDARQRPGPIVWIAHGRATALPKGGSIEGDAPVRAEPSARRAA